MKQIIKTPTEFKDTNKAFIIIHTHLKCFFWIFLLKKSTSWGLVNCPARHFCFYFFNLFYKKTDYTHI